jgi:hypothetical protein
VKIANLQTLVANADTPAVITIYHPSGDPYRGADGKPATITVVGAESKRAIAARFDYVRRLRDERASKDPSEAERRDFSMEETQANRIENAAALVVDWSGWEDNEDRPVEPTLENIKMVLGTAEHILAQVEVGINRHGAGSFFTLNSRG